MPPCSSQVAVQEDRRWRSAPSSPARLGQQHARGASACVYTDGCFPPLNEDVYTTLQQLEKAASEMKPDHTGVHADSCEDAFYPVLCNDAQAATAAERSNAPETATAPTRPLQLRRTWHQLHDSSNDHQSRAQLRDILAAGATKRVSAKGVSLATSVLDQAVLDHCRFHQADMERVSLRGARIRKTSFFATNLRYAVFDDAFLADVDFTGADLTGASFRGCNPACFLDSIAWYGACLHDVAWPNATVAQQLQHRSSCRCDTSSSTDNGP